MAIYITQHAATRAAERLGIANAGAVRDGALAAMVFGRREKNNFVHDGVVWSFNTAMDTLKTVYLEEK